MTARRLRSLLGGIEAGGTKFVCAIAAHPCRPLASARFPTLEPTETMSKVGDFFRDATEIHGPLDALGVGTFGPAGVEPSAASYGKILRTPKKGWTGFDFLGNLRSLLRDPELPIAFETDVNAAALGEAVHGAARGYEHVAYVTVGTGIGGGLLVAGRPLHGRMHPEIGHMFVGAAPSESAVSSGGSCPFHDYCLEGRASGPAMEKRAGMPGADLPASDPAWAVEAEYLAMGLVNLTAAWSPEIVVLGGGVSRKEGLIATVRERFREFAGGYWDLPPLEKYIVSPALGQRAGIVGALTLASRSCE